MLNDFHSITRSKSDYVIYKPTVLSPTPIKRPGLNFLEEIPAFNGEERADDSPDFRGRLPVRKFQSVGVLNLEERWLERAEESSQGENTERNICENGLNNSCLQSSSYSISEIPTRAANPLIKDLKFTESEKEKTILDGIGAFGNFAPESAI